MFFSLRDQVVLRRQKCGSGADVLRQRCWTESWLYDLNISLLAWFSLFPQGHQIESCYPSNRSQCYLAKDSYCRALQKPSLPQPSQRPAPEPWLLAPADRESWEARCVKRQALGSKCTTLLTSGESLVSKESTSRSAYSLRSFPPSFPGPDIVQSFSVFSTEYDGIPLERGGDKKRIDSTKRLRKKKELFSSF